MLRIAKKGDSKPKDEKDPKANKPEPKKDGKDDKSKSKPPSVPKEAPQGPPMGDEAGPPMDDAMPVPDMPMEMPMETPAVEPDPNMPVDPSGNNPQDGMLPVMGGDLLPAQLVVYMDSSQGPFQCDHCRYWAGSQCSKVEDATDPGGMCNLFNPTEDAQSDMNIHDGSGDPSMQPPDASMPPTPGLG